ncbi:MAG: ABC transporter permease [Muribaculaceae bacterium]|nr:ABC transporter permease [Muribaculaceae bacterium]MDE6753609.1 ABC transporter permease [Muribaculaceae bacterium]
MNYFRQIIYEMKHQRMMTWVAISGTALSIFLVMAFFIVDNLSSVDIAPESSRSRILLGAGIHIKEGDQYDSSGMDITLSFAEKIYTGLDGIEEISIVRGDKAAEQLSTAGNEPFVADGRKVDANYWKIFDFKFIDGKPFDDSKRASSERSVVLSRSAARRLFNEDKVAGRDIELRMIPYHVVGVVEDVSPLLDHTYGHFFTALDVDQYRNVEKDELWGGSLSVILKMKEGVDASYIKKQVKSRYDRLAAEIKKQNKELIYHQQPFTTEELSHSFGSNNDPDMASHHRSQWIIYTILLLLPAINLSSMTRSRLRHRVSEIGVRRAFGAKKVDIIGQLLGENLLITCIGGLIGFILCLFFLYLASHLFFEMSGIFETSLEVLNVRPDLSMLFRWQNFLIAFVVCFILNIVSATVPAWQASRRNPAEAISGVH